MESRSEEFRQILKEKRETLIKALSPHAHELINLIPSLNSSHPDLRSRYRSDPQSAVEQLISLVVAQEAWSEFFAALKAVRLESIWSYFNAGTFFVVFHKLNLNGSTRTQRSKYWI